MPCLRPSTPLTTTRHQDHQDKCVRILCSTEYAILFVNVHIFLRSGSPERLCALERLLLLFRNAPYQDKQLRYAPQDAQLELVYVPEANKAAVCTKHPTYDWISKPESKTS